MDDRNVLIAGIPRSGTTLTCHLLNSVPDTVALHEPMGDELMGEVTDPCAMIDGFISKNRATLLSDRTARSKHVDGKVPENSISEVYAEDGLRKTLGRVGIIRFEKPLTPDFLLAIKHTAGFTALLDRVLDRYRCYAIIRNPLPVLASWQSVDIPLNRGRSPVGEHLDPGLRHAMANISGVLDRQLCALHWFCDRISSLLSPDRILRYEEIVTTGGRALSAITPRAAELNRTLRSQNKNGLYRRETYAMLGERLLRSDGAYWKLYSRQSVEALLSEPDAV